MSNGSKAKVLLLPRQTFHFPWVMFLQADARTQSCHTIYAWGWAERANQMHVRKNLFEGLSELPKRSHVVIKMITVHMLKDAEGHGCQAWVGQW